MPPIRTNPEERMAVCETLRKQRGVAAIAFVLLTAPAAHGLNQRLTGVEDRRVIAKTRT